MKDKDETIFNFWNSLSEYPKGYQFIEERRYFDLKETIENYGFLNKSVLDLGCGDGESLFLLNRCSKLEKIYGFDFSSSLISIAKNKLPKGFFKEVNLKDYTLPEPNIDLVISFGVLIYLIDDNDVISFLSKLENQKNIIIRNPCSLNDTLLIDKYSEKLYNEYCAKYRTVEEMENLIKISGLKVKNVKRSFPDEIESSFGTKQYYFHLEG